MNIFENHQGIYGKIDAEKLSNALQEFLSLTKDIRNRLGEKSYLLDKYVFDLLTAIDTIDIYNAMEAGEEAASELWGLVKHKLNKPEEANDHSLYEIISNYIDEHPFKYQEDETVTSLYIIGLAGEYLHYIINQYIEDCRDSVRAEIDFIQVRHLYNQICELLGSEEPMERLNFIIRQRFIIANPISIFVQGLTVSLLYSLTTRDMETDKPMFILAMRDEEKEESPGDTHNIIVPKSCV